MNDTYIMDNYDLEDEITYTEEELEAIFKDYTERVWQRSNRKAMMRKLWQK